MPPQKHSKPFQLKDLEGSFTFPEMMGKGDLADALRRFSNDLLRADMDEVIAILKQLSSVEMPESSESASEMISDFRTKVESEILKCKGLYSKAFKSIVDSDEWTIEQKLDIVAHYMPNGLMPDKSEASCLFYLLSLSENPRLLMDAFAAHESPAAFARMVTRKKFIKDVVHNTGLLDAVVDFFEDHINEIPKMEVIHLAVYLLQRNRYSTEAYKEQSLRLLHALQGQTVQRLRNSLSLSPSFSLGI